MAFLMEFTVLSILTTTPLRSPCDGCDPMPIISTPRSVISPTTAQTFDVPISKPTTMLCFFAMAFCYHLGAMCHFLTVAPAGGGPRLDHQNLHPTPRDVPHVPAKALERGPGVAPCLPNYPNPCVTPLGKRSYREPPDPQPQNGSPKYYGNPWPSNRSAGRRPGFS